MKKKICIACLLVSCVWLILLMLHWLNLKIDLKIPAVLMGGTVVGIMYTVGSDWLLRARLIYLVFGFGAAYALLNSYWLIAGLAVVGALGVALGARRGRAPAEKNPQVVELEKKMKNCC